MAVTAAAAGEIIAAGAPIPRKLPPPATDTDMETSSRIFCDIFACLILIILLSVQEVVPHFI